MLVHYAFSVRALIARGDNSPQSVDCASYPSGDRPTTLSSTSLHCVAKTGETVDSA